VLFIANADVLNNGPWVRLWILNFYRGRSSALARVPTLVRSEQARGIARGSRDGFLRRERTNGDPNQAAGSVFRNNSLSDH